MQMSKKNKQFLLLRMQIHVVSLSTKLKFHFYLPLQCDKPNPHWHVLLHVSVMPIVSNKTSYHNIIIVDKQ